MTVGSHQDFLPLGHNCATPAGKWQVVRWVTTDVLTDDARVSQEEYLRLSMGGGVKCMCRLGRKTRECGTGTRRMRAGENLCGTQLPFASVLPSVTHGYHSSTSRPACATCLRGRDVLLGIDPTPALKAFAALREWLAGSSACAHSRSAIRVQKVYGVAQARMMGMAIACTLLIGSRTNGMVTDEPQAAFLSYKAPGAGPEPDPLSLRYAISVPLSDPPTCTSLTSTATFAGSHCIRTMTRLHLCSTFVIRPRSTSLIPVPTLLRFSLIIASFETSFGLNVPPDNWLTTDFFEAQGRLSHSHAAGAMASSTEMSESRRFLQVIQ
ncbi:hypothetical protein EDB86DRAFT_2824825 [Lactarius hatsudake]|nr:hypothetical protein EDB86DRAFT_2824825 [Lactarius hatsudake]